MLQPPVLEAKQSWHCFFTLFLCDVLLQFLLWFSHLRRREWIGDLKFEAFRFYLVSICSRGDRYSEEKLSWSGLSTIG